MATQPSPASPIDAHLATLPAERRALLERLRGDILAHVPDVVECISYGIPAFRWRGKVIAGFAATAGGGSYYPFSGTTLAAVADALGARSRTKSALHFDAADPLPRGLVRRLLDARMAEVEAAMSSRRGARRSVAPR